jgi:hypothetical protein
LFNEITASSLLKIDIDGNQINPSEYEPNRAGFIIHSAIHMVRPDARCVKRGTFPPPLRARSRQPRQFAVTSAPRVGSGPVAPKAEPLGK